MPPSANRPNRQPSNPLIPIGRPLTKADTPVRRHPCKLLPAEMCMSVGMAVVGLGAVVFYVLTWP